MNHRSNFLLASAFGLAILMPATTLLAGPHFSDWQPATPDLDTNNSVAGGCPIESRDGLALYTASSRPGGLGGIDIWVATRFELDEPFGEAQNLGEPVNSAANDFCPTPLNQNFLLFVSDRGGDDSCGGGDIYIVKRNPAKGWGKPVNLGCADTGDGPNTSGGEFGPSLVKTDDGVFLFFSSNGSGNMDLFISEFIDGHFSPGVRIDELSTDADDRMPNVSKDGREIVWSSNRATWGDGQPAHGGQDVYSSRRDSTSDSWSEPVNLGPGINTDADETRASMSWDRFRLHFGRAGEIYVSERSKLKGRK